MKRTINETQLRKIVRQSVNKILKEGTTNQAVYNKWLDIEEEIGAESMLDYIWNCLNAEKLEEIVNYIWKEEDLDYRLKGQI